MRIRPTHRALDDGTLELRCEVTDTGIGIAADVKDVIFTRFTQADRSISRRFGGTGLGLSICKQMTEMMGGDIGVDSTLGEGSTFWFTIRCARGVPQARVVADVGGAVDVPGRALRILAAEDHRINQMLLTNLLCDAGHHIDVVGTGREALDAVRSAPYDAILMDIQMPEMDGLTATREIRALGGAPAEIPIIALSANAMAGDREKCLRSGMDDYLAKPMRAGELFRVLDRAVVRKGSGDGGAG